MRGFTVLSVLLCVVTCRFAFAFKDGPLDNGNFEEAPKSSDLNGTVVLKSNAIPHWETSGFVEYIKAGQKQGDMLLVVPEGFAAVRLGNEASIKQRVNVTVGSLYAITFSAARTCAQAEELNVSVKPDFGVMPIQTLYSSSGWDLYAWAFRAIFDVAEILLHNPGEEEDPACGPLIDSIGIRVLNPPKATKFNLLKNADFEEGAYMFPNATTGVLIPPNIEDDNSALPAWMVESLKAVKYIDAAHFSVPHGQRAIELVGGRESAIAQVARTIAGKTYELTFAVGDASNSCEGSMIVEAFAGRDTLKVPYESEGTGGYKRAVLRFVAVSNRTRIMFLSTYYHTRSDDYASLCGPEIIFESYVDQLMMCFIVSLGFLLRNSISSHEVLVFSAHILIMARWLLIPRCLIPTSPTCQIAPLVLSNPYDFDSNDYQDKVSHTCAFECGIIIEVTRVKSHYPGTRRKVRASGNPGDDVSGSHLLGWYRISPKLFIT